MNSSFVIFIQTPFKTCNQKQSSVGRKWTISLNVRHKYVNTTLVSVKQKL